MRKQVSLAMTTAIAAAGPSLPTSLRAAWAKALNEERRRAMDTLRPLAPSSSRRQSRTDADSAVLAALFESRVQQEEAQFSLLCDYIVRTAKSQ